MQYKILRSVQFQEMNLFQDNFFDTNRTNALCKKMTTIYMKICETEFIFSFPYEIGQQYDFQIKC